MAIQFACPACGRSLKVPDTAGGHKIRCPYCKTVGLAPGSTGAPAPDDSLRDLAGLESGEAMERPDPPPVPRHGSRPAPDSSAAPRRRPSRAGARGASPGAGTFLNDCLGSLGYGIRNLPTCFGVIFLATFVYLLLTVPLVFLSSHIQGMVSLVLAILQLLVSLVVMGYFLQFYLNVVVTSFSKDTQPPTLPEFQFGELIRTAIRGLGILLVYVLPVVTLPLLPLGWLALAQTGDGRALDLFWAGRAAARCPGRLVQLWVVLLVQAAIGIALLVLLCSLGGSVLPRLMDWMGDSLNVGRGGQIAICLLGALAFARVAGSLMTAVTCGAYRCIGFLGRHNPEILDMLPGSAQSLKTLATAGVSVVLSCVTVYAGIAWLQNGGVTTVAGVISWAGWTSQEEIGNRDLCEGHLRKIGEAMASYRRQHGGAYPPDLAALYPSTWEASPDCLVCPATGHPAPEVNRRAGTISGNVDYLYRMGDVNWEGDNIVCYEEPANHRRKIVNVLRADGVVEGLTASQLSNRLAQAPRLKEALPVSVAKLPEATPIPVPSGTPSPASPLATPQPATPTPTPRPAPRATPRPAMTEADRLTLRVPFKDSNGLWGFLDSENRTVIPAKWRTVSRFSEGLAMVEYDLGAAKRVSPGPIGTAGRVLNDSFLPKFGYIDANGVPAMTQLFFMADNFRDGHATVYKREYWAAYDPVVTVGKNGAIGIGKALAVAPERGGAPAGGGRRPGSYPDARQIEFDAGLRYRSERVLSTALLAPTDGGKPFVVALDLTTTSVKRLVIDKTGQVVSQTDLSGPTSRPAAARPVP